MEFLLDFDVLNAVDDLIVIKYDKRFVELVNIPAHLREEADEVVSNIVNLDQLYLVKPCKIENTIYKRYNSCKIRFSRWTSNNWTNRRLGR